MLELINVCKTFNPGTVNAKTALNDLNLTLNDGDFVTVIGGNGAGKSTMLNAIAGSFQIDSGKIVIDGTDVTGLPEHYVFLMCLKVGLCNRFRIQHQMLSKLLFHLESLY